LGVRSSGHNPRQKFGQGQERGKTTGRQQKKMAIYKPRSEFSEETNPADTLTSDFQPLEYLGNISAMFEPGVCGSFYFSFFVGLGD
jgi:hypothetical protein